MLLFFYFSDANFFNFSCSSFLSNPKAEDKMFGGILLENTFNIFEMRALVASVTAFVPRIEPKIDKTRGKFFF